MDEHGLHNLVASYLAYLNEAAQYGYPAQGTLSSQHSASIFNADSPDLFLFENDPILGAAFPACNSSHSTAPIGGVEHFSGPLGEGQVQLAFPNQPLTRALYSLGLYLPAPLALFQEHLRTTGPSTDSIMHLVSSPLGMPSPGSSNNGAPSPVSTVHEPTAIEQLNQLRAANLLREQREIYDDITCIVPAIKQNFLDILEGLLHNEPTNHQLSGLFFVTELPKTEQGHGRRVSPMDYRCLLCTDFCDTRKDKAIKHAQHHLRLKPLPCGKCPQTFRRNWDLIRHQRIVHSMFHPKGKGGPRQKQDRFTPTIQMSHFDLYDLPNLSTRLPPFPRPTALAAPPMVGNTDASQGSEVGLRYGWILRGEYDTSLPRQTNAVAVSICRVHRSLSGSLCSRHLRKAVDTSRTIPCFLARSNGLVSMAFFSYFSLCLFASDFRSSMHLSATLMTLKVPFCVPESRMYIERPSKEILPRVVEPMLTVFERPLMNHKAFLDHLSSPPCLVRMTCWELSEQ